MKLKAKFQDEDFDLGEVVEVLDIAYGADGTILLKADAKRGGRTTFAYKTLAEFNEEWEDCDKECETYFYISMNGFVGEAYINKFFWNTKDTNERKEIGNYFATEEEAERAVEKLKAWKRLKEANIDCKLTYEYDDSTETVHACGSFSFNSYPLAGKDLDLLFGGEE